MSSKVEIEGVVSTMPAIQSEESARNGLAFKVSSTAAVASVVAIPTTAHGLCIYNNEPDGGKSVVIDFVSSMNIVAAATLGQAQLICLLGQVREAVAVNSALLFQKRNGLGSGATVFPTLMSVLSTTALPAGTGLAASWFACGNQGIQSVASLPGFGNYWDADGRIIVPPGRYFAVNTMSNSATNTFTYTIAGTLKQLTLGS